jgi:hypothetical protein
VLGTTGRPLTNQQLECFMATADLTAQRLRELLDYCPLRGHFHRKDGSSAKVHHSQGGTGQIRIDGKFITASAAAWAIHYGEWPTGNIRHLSGDKTDFRISNLVISADWLASRGLHELFTYSPEDGSIRAAIARGRIEVGDVLGSVSDEGYLQVSIPGRPPMRAHRLAWHLMTGAAPSGDIDHKNGIRTDNRWDNLRDVSRSVNTQNQRRARADNKSTGVLGVSVRARDGAYIAQIQDANGKKRTIGAFASVEEASAAYVWAKRHLHAGCTI